jgi:hypothetical protein
MISWSHSVTERHENETGTWIVDRAVPLHQDLGPGLLEAVYEVLWPPSYESEDGRLSVGFPFGSNRRGPRFDESFRTNLIVEGKGHCGTQVS